ncbi:unnamed protein product [Rhizoctonia solani]|uniref:Rab-GAP TBC domain-containing protein n=1 Tax=Rhizoctonia solani TaxID=456999 RepID=A0A8H3GH30_9AGAM|nr:unnamed protein product [Rhizoctonia solani]
MHRVLRARVKYYDYTYEFGGELEGLEGEVDDQLALQFQLPATQRTPEANSTHPTLKLDVQGGDQGRADKFLSDKMKLNIANPATGEQKTIDFDDERRYRVFYEKRIAQEVPGDSLGDEFKGYIFRITGGNDKQGFPMKQGVLLPYRVRLLLSDGHSCYRPRRTGERKRKSVRGCIVGPDIAVLSLVIVKQGDAPLPGLTENVLPKRLGPKRATKIRKFFNLGKEDDVRKFVVRREVKSKKNPDAKPYTKAPKIQRLVTPLRLQRRRHLRAIKRRRIESAKEQKAEFDELVAKRVAEKKQKIAAKASQKNCLSGPLRPPPEHEAYCLSHLYSLYDHVRHGHSCSMSRARREVQVRRKKKKKSLEMVNHRLREYLTGTNDKLVSTPTEQSQQHKEKRKKQLTELILGVLERRPQLSYFQGYHDILSTLQLTLHPSLDKDTEAWQLLQECAIKITLHRARDAMGAGLEPLTGQLRILRRLIRLADPDLAILIEEASPLPYWAISPLMTLYTHDLPTLALAQRVMDWMLARPPNAVIYLVAAFVLQKKEEIQKLVEDGDDGMMHSFLSSLPDLEADELPEPVDAQENDQSSSTHAPFNSDLLTLNSDVPSDVDSSRDDLTSSLVSVQPPSYTEKASQLPASSLDELQDSPNQPTGLNPPAPPSPASSLSSLPPELPNIDHQSGPTVPLSQILQAADRLRTRYPISYEKLRLKETLGPHSMLRTWSEDPDEIIGDDEAEEYVLATDQIVYPDLDDDVFEPYPPPQPVKLSKTRTLLARLPKIDMMAYAAFGLVAVAVVANSPTAREHTKRLAEVGSGFML